MSSSQIVINSNNYDTDRKSFVYQFPVAQNLLNHEMAVTSINIFNSFYNISQDLNNNVMTIKFPSGASDYITVNYTIPDGFYDTSSFYLLLQKAMYDNKLYIVNSDSSSKPITYYLNLAVSETQYANILTSFSVPTTATPPIDAPWSQLTGTQRSPTITFNSANGLLFGYTAGEYGSTSDTSLSTVSNITPQINPSQTVVLRCNAIQNIGLSFPSNFLYALPINASFGSLITQPQHEQIYNRIAPSQYSEIEIRLYDQNLEPLYLRDTNALITLSIRKTKEE